MYPLYSEKSAANISNLEILIMSKTYIAIDLKSYYASVECQERGVDPLKTNLVVADLSRTEKTICLAVSPSLKAYGIPGRARLFEVVQRVKEINRERLRHAPGHTFTGKSYDADELANDPSLAHGVLYGIQYADRQYLPEICLIRGYARLLH